MPGGRPLRPISEYSTRELTVGLILSTTWFSGLTLLGLFWAYHAFQLGNTAGLGASTLGVLVFGGALFGFMTIYLREFRRRATHTGPKR